jgi:hypothetical protein
MRVEFPHVYMTPESIKVHIFYKHPSFFSLWKCEISVEKSELLRQYIKGALNM